MFTKGVTKQRAACGADRIADQARRVSARAAGE